MSPLMAKLTCVGGSDLVVQGWTGLRGRSALQILGSAAAALDRLPRGAEQAASGKCCGKADRKVAGHGVNAALHDRVAALGAATILGCILRWVRAAVPL